MIGSRGRGPGPDLPFRPESTPAPEPADPDEAQSEDALRREADRRAKEVYERVLAEMEEEERARAPSPTAKVN